MSSSWIGHVCVRESALFESPSIPRVVHGLGQPERESSPAHSSPGLDLKSYYLGRAWIIYLGPFNKQAGLGLISGEPKPSQTRQ